MRACFFFLLSALVPLGNAVELELVELVPRNDIVVDPPEFDRPAPGPSDGDDAHLSLSQLTELAAAAAATPEKMLTLSQRDVGVVTAELLVKALEAGAFQGLNSLVCQSQRLKDDGVALLAEAAAARVVSSEARTFPRELFLGNAEIFGSSRAIHALCALISSGSVTSLNLRYNKLGLRSTLPLGALAESIAASSDFRELVLDFNPVRDAGLKALADGGVLSSSLRKLSLQFSGIEPEGARVLSYALQRNRDLRELDLVGNKIGRKGVRLVTEALCDHEHIRTIRLWGSDINDQAVEFLVAFLEGTNQIEDLGLWGTTISDKGALVLAKSIEQSSRSSLTITLSNSKIGTRGETALRALVAGGKLHHLDLTREADLGSSGKSLSKEGRAKADKMIQDFNNKMKRAGAQ